VLPIIDVYQAIDTIAKPVVAAVNGFAVGGGNVLHTVCDLTIAAENAVFRQVGPMVGSFDAGYGTWYLEDTIGRKRAKEMWYLNRKYSAAEALGMGLVNEVVPAGQALARAQEVAAEIATRSPMAIAGLKGAFSARHNGVSGQARMAHDQMLTLYLATKEAHEVSDSFGARRAPDPATGGARAPTRTNRRSSTSSTTSSRAGSIGPATTGPTRSTPPGRSSPTTGCGRWAPPRPAAVAART
jgi:naphthoate synthase